MSLPLLLLIGSTITLVFMAGVFRLEDARGGQYVCCARVRMGVNALYERIERTLGGWHPYLGRGFFRLIMHYLAHSVLRRVLRFVRRLEQGIETTMRRNRQVAKAIDAEKRQTHLTALSEHKEETALTERQKQRLRAHR